MTTRRNFLAKASLAGTALAAAPFIPAFASKQPQDFQTTFSMEEHKKTTLPEIPLKAGIGGVAAGNGWHENTDEQINEALEAAWSAGIRHYDTSPFYGFGLSERRFGHFLFDKKRSDYVLSTKVGRLFAADPNFKANPKNLFKGNLNFKYRFDYTADGVRRSVEDSLLRLGLSSIDIVYVHDLSPDTGELGEKWTQQFDIAAKGAFPALTRMREEGIIKAWGLGVNTPQPILKAMEVSDPDVMLVAIQYSLLDHQDALEKLFPAMQQKGVKAVIGGPLNGGFLAGYDRFNYGPTVPAPMQERRQKIQAIADRHQVDLRTAALQFCTAHPVVAAVIPGASTAAQAVANAVSMSKVLPEAFWSDLKSAGLIAAGAPIPKAV
ncbi:aldo/keto reductase [Dyadobacter sandarakinus]|uniref:Aldo/keto reductase n=1 Tax=Dyadobacter sandarakinus TaxID=2747268 RepID=A0ABX7I3X7_9BACT|nr:aldo/keto reductase [Dyadobacter sandarakinus]QRR00570.1 aldo/keto reductase [Dyadobacter sandarakinus]